MEANPIVLDDAAGDVVVVVVEGEHDIYTAPTLRPRPPAARPRRGGGGGGRATTPPPPARRDGVGGALERRGGVVVDLTKATFVDSSVLGALLDARRRAHDASQGFVVCVRAAGEPGAGARSATTRTT